MGKFVTLDMGRVEIIHAEYYYGTGYTKNKAKSFAVWDTL